MCYEPTNTAAWRSVVWGERKTTQAVGAGGLSVCNSMWRVGTRNKQYINGSSVRGKLEKAEMVVIKGKTAAGKKKSYYITMKAYNKVISRGLKFWVTQVGFFCLFSSGCFF